MTETVGMAFAIGPYRRDDMTEHMEELARHSFAHKFPGATLTGMQYRYDPGGHTATDPETGEPYLTPPVWYLFVEGETE